jgi:hypothetical protein
MASSTPDVLGIGVVAAQPLPPPDPDIPFKDAKERLIEVWEGRIRQEPARAVAAGNVTQRRGWLGLDRAHLYRILRKHGIAELPNRHLDDERRQGVVADRGCRSGCGSL